MAALRFVGILALVSTGCVVFLVAVGNFDHLHDNFSNGSLVGQVIGTWLAIFIISLIGVSISVLILGKSPIGPTATGATFAIIWTLLMWTVHLFESGAS